MIPGAPSYVKRGAATTAQQYRVHLLTSREGQQHWLDNTWLVHLLSYIKRGAATTARQQYLAGGAPSYVKRGAATMAQRCVEEDEGTGTLFFFEEQQHTVIKQVQSSVEK
jgi:hypothetical protein